MNQHHYDALETRHPALRARDLAVLLPQQVAHAKAFTAARAIRLSDVDPDSIQTVSDSRNLPILRKSDLGAEQAAQRAHDPFGGYAACGWGGRSPVRRAKRVFQSPGPIYEPQGEDEDAWRAARALFAAGFRAGDLVHNSFSYHLTPAGVLMEDGALALGCTVFPAGVGNSELQLTAMLDLRPHGYTGTPGFLKSLVESAELRGAAISVRKALLSGEPYPPSLRDWFKERNIEGYQCYASADLGLIAYETEAREGLVVDEGVVVEILTPGTGDPVPDGEVGEVVVTTLNRDYPLLRFATGDLSAILPGQCPTGRTNARIRGWLGRADQATKVRGMFVHPTHLSEVVRRHPEVVRVRLVVDGKIAEERLALHAETNSVANGLAEALVATVRDLTRLRADVHLVAPGELPNDGKMIDDRRSFD